MNILFPDSVKKYVGLQCNGDISLYNDLPELKYIGHYLSELHPIKCLDIGSGIGRASVHFFKKYEWNSTTFLLLDGNYGEKQFCAIRENNNEFYNSFDAANEFCTANGLSNFILCDASKDTWEKEHKDIDLAYSFLAIGFHWPINFYMDKLKNTMKKGGLVIFGIRGKEKSTWVEKQVEEIDQSEFNIVEFILTETVKRESVLILEKK